MSGWEKGVSSLPLGDWQTPPPCSQGRERHQSLLLPPSIEDYVRPDDPVRAYDAFVDALDLEGFQYVAHEDVYLCPAGQKLPCRRHEVDRRRWAYGLLGKTCRQCQHFGICTTNRLGRKLIR